MVRTHNWRDNYSYSWVDPGVEQLICPIDKMIFHIIEVVHFTNIIFLNIKILKNMILILLFIYLPLYRFCLFLIFNDDTNKHNNNNNNNNNKSRTFFISLIKRTHPFVQINKY